MKYLLSLAIGMVFMTSGAKADTYQVKNEAFKRWHTSEIIGITVDEESQKVTSEAPLWSSGPTTEFHAIFASPTVIIAVSQEPLREFQIMIEINLANMTLKSGPAYQSRSYNYFHFWKYEKSELISNKN